MKCLLSLVHAAIKGIHTKALVCAVIGLVLQRHKNNKNTSWELMKWIYPTESLNCTFVVDNTNLRRIVFSKVKVDNINRF